MVKWKELSHLPKRRYTGLLWRLQNLGSPSSVLQPNWRPSDNSGDQYVEPEHPATRLPPMTFPRVRGNGLEIRLIPQAFLKRPQILFPFQRDYITWEQRVAWVKEQGYTTTWVARPETKASMARNSELKNDAKTPSSRLPALVDKDGKVIGTGKNIPPVQLYPPLDWNTHVFPDRRTVPQGGVRKLVLKRLEHRVPMSLMTAVSKERMGSKRYMRQRLVKKIKLCLSLIISKGAYSEEVVVEDKAAAAVVNKPEKGKTKGNPAQASNVIEVEEQSVAVKPILFDEQEAEEMGRRWIMQGWTYLIFPSTALYLMPYSKLVAILRDNLKTLHARGVMLENNWLSWALLHSREGQSDPRDGRRRDGIKAETSKPLVSKSHAFIRDKGDLTSGGDMDKKIQEIDSTTCRTKDKLLRTLAPSGAILTPQTRTRRAKPTKRGHSLASSYPGFDNKAWLADISAGLEALQNFVVEKSLTRKD
ncbi:hypothetical protein BJ165DRAFT_161598 [Panaeolus papilionaceus]|nr:hypothetical protein BJ165DRAFT_161598 [Panaeolus papilionaceus]